MSLQRLADQMLMDNSHRVASDRTYMPNWEDLSVLEVTQTQIIITQAATSLTHKSLKRQKLVI